MGGQDEQANIATGIVSDSLQSIANYCTITCNDNISNQNITVIGGNATISLSQSCSAIGAECQVKNLINTQIDNLIDNMVKQNESNLGIFSLLGPSSNSNTNLTNSIKNQVSQIIKNTCQPSVNNIDTNNTVFAQDANLNLNIAQTGNINNAQCALDTVSKILLNNTVKNSVTQTESSCKDVILVLIIIVVVALIFLIWPILRALSKRTASIIEPSGAGVKGKIEVNKYGQIEVKVPIWQRTWFKILMAIIIIALIAGIIYWIVKDIDSHKKNKENAGSGGTINNTGNGANNEIIN